MIASARDTPKREFFPGLGGLRGYSILIVFVAHYLGPGVLPTDGSPILSALERVFAGLLFVVPIFFVISGFLIGDLLLETRDREGHFKVFYARRLLQISPAYYLTLLVLAGISAWHGASIDPRFWMHFLFVQNLLPGYLDSQTVPAVSQMGHLWFLAVDAQFYAVWPLVVWFFPKRSQILRITWFLIALVCAVRFAAPFLHFSIGDCYVSTATRADAILLGVAMSICRHGALYKKFVNWAQLAAILAVSAMVFIAFWTGTTWPSTYKRVAIIHPLANLTAALIVMAAMRPNGYFLRFCSFGWARWLGSLSFGIYIFHFVYSNWFLNSVVPRLGGFMSTREALATSALLAFILTIALAVLNGRLLEQLARPLKRRFKYGERKTTNSSVEALELQP